ncbi:MAG: patatin-like phospholipase family protein [Rhodanobacteraceae bacterium]|nr:patatin-like phospholipase family protein [Rhodanobacteraceae bacterium]MBL0041596.1 patatin-like phospholipase family protein [Xanthomonadales bacterium]MBP6078058.1 patatin-like phospholipase family protein [Xanthomonadales bacterium]MBP7622562.1 patatin-like phospholipase family protein [Xanthomonadales bacterium]
MLTVQASTKPIRKRSRPRIGLAVAGGGPIGGMYELGALRAMDEAMDGLDMTGLDVYVGVSSGAFLASGLANRLDTAEMCRIFLTDVTDQERFRPEIFLRPAMGEYAKRVAAIPRTLLGWLGDLATHPLDTNFTDVFGRLGALIPTGLFDNNEIEHFLRKLFEAHGRTNDFRKLSRKLFVIGVELDTGKTVRFGSEGLDHVPISRAIQASAALPGLYPPVEIDGRYYVDGALRRTLHASVALEAGAELVLGINPLVPFDASLATANLRKVPDSLVDSGLPAVLSQTFRTMLKSRMQVGLDKYQKTHERADLLVFEPSPDDVEMFFTNPFSYTMRQRVAEHAYRATLDDLAARYDEVAPIFARHGITLRRDIIDDPERSLMEGLGRRPRRTDVTARLRHALDDLDRAIHERKRR